MRLQLLLGTLPLLACGPAMAQYDTLWIGTADGPSTSLANTPFPTEVARAARTQYVVEGTVLQQLNLYPSTDIYGICLQVVDDDISDPACLLDLHTEMKNESSGNLTDFILPGLTATGTSNGVNLNAGILGLMSNTTHWQWVGAGSNMIIEVNYERGEQAGLSPRILLDMDLNYTATYTGRTQQNILGHDITSGYPSDVEIDSDNSLPVLGLLVASSTGTDKRANAGHIGLFPNPASSIVEVRAPSSTHSIRISDMFGRTLLQQQWTAAMNKVDVSGLPAGCYTVSALYGQGVTGTSGRFIKE